jgi:steroid delta-isomerase-like uncharacterized protein
MHDESIARRFLSAWNAGSESIVDDLAAPDLVVSYSHFPEPLRGAEAFKAALRQTHACFPDLRIEADEVLPTPGGTVVRWRYRGTHRSGELFGVAPAGTPVEVQGISVYRIRDGRVHEEVGVVDNLGLMTQLREAPSRRSPPAG